MRTDSESTSHTPAVPLLRAVRGMNDALPHDMHRLEVLLSRMRTVLHAYAYQQVRTPVVESTALFERAVGATSDIVEKEMYTFTDRNGDSLTLRPEGTASCVRMGIEHGLFYHRSQKWWYSGPMYRHERPQKGRYREFFQLGVEAFGFAGPEIDAEIIDLSRALLCTVGLPANALQLQLNTIGTPDARRAYTRALQDYFRNYYADLDPDSQRRLERNPLRILDSKHERTRSIAQAAPDFVEYCDQESWEHFEYLCRLLTELHIPFTHNKRLVRGLDYYHRTVFEWVTPHLGAQATVCAGGRYDGLVGYLGGEPTPAIGFAMGLERLAELLGDTVALQPPMVYMVSLNEKACADAVVWASRWRLACPEWMWAYEPSQRSLKAQLKKAHQLGVPYAIVAGMEGTMPEQVLIKHMKTGKQEQVLWSEALQYLRAQEENEKGRTTDASMG